MLNGLAPSGLSMPDERSDEVGRARRTRVLIGAVVVITATLVVIVGWYAHSGSMIRLGFDNTLVMRMNTAVWMLLLAVAVIVRWRWVRWVLLFAVLITALLTVLEYRLGFDAGIDQFLVNDWDSAAGTFAEGRPSETSAFAVICLAIGLLRVDMGRYKTAEVFMLVPLALSMLTIYGYAFGSTQLYSIGPYSAVGFDTGLVMILLTGVCMLSVPEGAAEWIWFGPDPGARLLRWLVPTALVVAPFTAWLIHKGADRGYYDEDMQLGLVVGFVALLMLAIGYGVGRRALALDRERDTLLNELQRVNDELEDRVRIRSHQLNRQRTKLALFEERDRIARDLHDRVIQRIFAAGLQVGALSRTAAKGVPVSDVAENLDLVATELDLAIRELRNSIFQLTSVDDQDGIEQVMHDVASRASRILGFMPHMMVDGEVTKISSEMVAQIASVMQEGLSNIARHAQASAAEVNVSASEGYLQVRISDDGVGLPDPLPRSSGISNLINRARNFGGTATWANGPDGGTVLVWRVPMDNSVVLDADAALEELSSQGNETPVMVSESDHSAAASSRS